MTDGQQRVRRYDGLQIDYSRMGEEDLTAALLQIGQHQGLWCHEATTDDGFHLVSTPDGRTYLLAASEVPGMVIGYAMATGLRLAPFAYRGDMEPLDTPKTEAGVERAPHDQ